MSGSKQQSTKTQNENANTTQSTQLNPEFAGKYNTALGGYNSLLGQGPGLNFSNSISPLLSNILAKGQSAIQGGANAANGQLASQLGYAGTGNNSALLASLQRQGQFHTAGAMNQLFSAAPGMQAQLNESQNNQKINAFNSQLGGYGNLLNSLGNMSQAGATHTTNATSDLTSTTKGKKSF